GYSSTPARACQVQGVRGAVRACLRARGSLSLSPSSPPEGATSLGIGGGGHDSGLTGTVRVLLRVQGRRPWRGWCRAERLHKRLRRCGGRSAALPGFSAALRPGKRSVEGGRAAEEAG